MKKFIAPLLALLVSGCQIDPYTHAPTLTSTTGMMLVWKMRYRAAPLKMTMHLAIHRRIAVYTLKDMPKGKRKLARPILLMPGDFLVKAFLPAAIMLKIQANCMKYGEKGLMKMPAQYD